MTSKRILGRKILNQKYDLSYLTVGNVFIKKTTDNVKINFVNITHQYILNYKSDTL